MPSREPVEPTQSDALAEIYQRQRLFNLKAAEREDFLKAYQPTDLPIAIEDLWKIDDVEGWEIVPGTVDGDSSVTTVYRFEKGRFFNVVSPWRTRGKICGMTRLQIQPRDFSRYSITEVYPHVNMVTTYRVNPQEVPTGGPHVSDFSARKSKRTTRIFWDKSESRAGAKRRRRMASWIRYFTGLPLRQCHEVTLRGWVDLEDEPALMMMEDFDWAGFEEYPEPDADDQVRHA